MVKRVIEAPWGCEFPGCGGRFPTELSARNCENQGSIGPEVKPGTVVNYERGYSDGFLIFLRTESDRGHVKRYHTLGLGSLLDIIDESSNSVFTRYWIDKENAFDLRGYENKKLAGPVKNRNFNRLVQLVHNGWGLERVREILEGYEVTSLHRAYPSFQD